MTAWPMRGQRTPNNWDDQLKAYIDERGATEINVKQAGAVGDGVTDDTAAIQSVLTASMLAGNAVYFPEGTYLVTNLTLDYNTVPAEPDSGPPYGYPAPLIYGAGQRRAVIKQKAGSTGPVLAISGRTGASAGPGTNNKIAGLSIRDLGIEGVSTGSHGLTLRSIVESSFSNLRIRSCGGSGVYIARETFSSGVDDEYAYGLLFTNVKMIANARYGFECSGTNAISATLVQCDATTNTLGGFLVAPTTMTLTGCAAFNNGIGNAAAFGLKAIRNTNLLSNNNTLTLVGFRSENNGAAGGYEILLGGGNGYTLIAPSIYATQGAHGLGVGVTNLGGEQVTWACSVLGGIFQGDAVTVGQKAVVARQDCTGLTVLNPRIAYTSFFGSNGTPSGSIDVTGASQVNVQMAGAGFLFSEQGFMRLTRKINTPGLPASGTAVLYIKDNGSGKTQLAVRFSSGVEQIIATEP